MVILQSTILVLSYR